MRELKIRNFRDLNGYTNRYGEILKSNTIFRGASLNEISNDDACYMEEILGIRYILDYRDEKEAALTPDLNFPNAIYERISALRISNGQAGFDFGNMLQEKMNSEKVIHLIDYLKDGYRVMAMDNPAYHRLFELLLRNDGFVYFHCSAGKDRTGISAFLIMLALGMSEEDGIKEYLLSNEYLKTYNEHILSLLGIPEEMKHIAEPLLFVNKENILLTIQSIKEKYNSYDEFLLKEYQLDEEKRKKLRLLYCEKR